MSLQPVSLARVGAIRAAAIRRLAEIGDHGCEAASARSFEEGRLAVLDDLGFRDMKIDLADASDDVIRRRRLDLDVALSTPKLRGSVDDEPIIRRAGVNSMTEPEEPQTEEVETEAEEPAAEESADEA